MHNETGPARLQGVDRMRAVAILAVVVIHARPFETLAAPVGQQVDLATVLNQLARFAVPFFFAAAGYFWAGKVAGAGGWAVTARSARRLLLLFIAWSLIYLLPCDLSSALSHGPAGPLKAVYWNLRRAAGDPVLTLLTGTEVHLWFLPSLLCAMLISALFVQLGLPRCLLGLAIALYLVGLAGKAYSATPWGWPTGFNFRNGPFFGLIFFVIGYTLHGRSVSAAWRRWGAGLLLLGYGLQAAELALLRTRYATPMGQDFVLGTLLVGTGVTLLALSARHHVNQAFVARLGPLTLGVYASHMLVLNLLRPLDARWSGNPLWEVLQVLAGFLGGWLLSLLLVRHRRTRWLVG